MGPLPRTFGSYTLFEPIGRGGMAELFLARTETELGATRLSVVKLILPAFADDPKFAEMLIHEAKLAARLSHRHIVQVLDLGRDEDRLYIAMEYVEGFDLNALLRKCSETKEGLPAPHALGIVADILEGLDYAHRRAADEGEDDARGGQGREREPLGIVHRDVSPSNILISYEGEVKLCDFGIAHANDLVREDENEALKGKAGYMSPEHARGELLDARADVFAAGIILWELLAGRRLYKPRIEMSLLEQARRAEIPPIPDKGLPNHEALERIVRRALAANRDERYPSAGAFQRDLEEYLADAGLYASRLKLGEWISTTFGTAIIDERRASERRLPKSSAPPPRSSGPMRRVKVPSESESEIDNDDGSITGLGDELDEALAASMTIPATARLPRDLRELDLGASSDAIAITPEESLPLFGAGAGGITLGTPKPPIAPTTPATALATPIKSIAASIASEPNTVRESSSSSSSASSQIESLASPSKDSDDELIAWAKRRGYVSFLFFFAVAVAVAVAYFLAR